MEYQSLNDVSGVLQKAMEKSEESPLDLVIQDDERALIVTLLGSSASPRSMQSMSHRGDAISMRYTLIRHSNTSV